MIETTVNPNKIDQLGKKYEVPDPVLQESESYSLLRDDI